MKILMIHTSYNELFLLRYKWEHCKKNNIDLFIIDNMSNDGTADWLKENKIPHSFIDTDNSFDLRPLLAEMTKKIHELKPDWFIYAGVDMFFEAQDGLKVMVENADRDGCTQIEMKIRTVFNVGEKVKKGNPFANYFYVSREKSGIYLSKYDESVRIIPDQIIRNNIVVKEDGGIIFEMHASKSISERKETLRRRQKAWDGGLDYNYGSHYRDGEKRNFTYTKAECFDVRKINEFELYKRLQEIELKEKTVCDMVKAIKIKIQ